MHPPSHCILCGALPHRTRWNSLEILECSACALAWRADFDLPADYYATLNAGSEPGEQKLDARLRNSHDRRRMARHFLPQRGVCDIGCGEGSFIAALKQGGYEEVWGVEPSRAAVTLAQTAGHDVVEGGVETLLEAREGRMLRAATLFHVIEHLPEPLEALQTIASALPPGGVIVLETPDIEAPLQRATAYRNSLIYPEHLYYFSAGSLQKMLEHAGFRVITMTHRSFDWRNTPIRSSLVRLRLVGAVMSGDRGDGGSERTPAVERSSNIVRRVLRKILAHLAHYLQRDDYILVIAQKV